MKYIRNISLLLSAVMLSLFLVSCGKDFQGDIDSLNDKHNNIDNRVKTLETQVATMNNQLTQLSVLATAVEKGFYVTAVKTTADGYELTLNNGHTIILQNGAGNTLTPMPAVSMTQISGLYFWTLNGVLLTGPDGKPIRTNGITPIVRFDSITQTWLISIDGGVTFRDVNVLASVIINDTVLMQVINNYIRQNSTTIISQEVLYQIISTYIQRNYSRLFDVNILNQVIVSYVNEHYMNIFNYELLEKIFNQYNFSYATTHIDVNMMVNLIVNFIQDNKEIFINNEVLYEIISNYIKVNQTTIFSNELLLEIINNFIENNTNFINVELLTQVVYNYIEEHKDVIIDNKVIYNLLMKYLEAYYVQIFDQNIVNMIISNYITQNFTTIFNETLIREVLNNYVENNYNTLIRKEDIQQIITNYIEVNQTTIIDRDMLIKVVGNYFQKNYNLFIDRTVITQVINDYIDKHHTMLIDIDILEKVISDYIKQYYVEIFNETMITEIITSYFKENQTIIYRFIDQYVGIIKKFDYDNEKADITLNNGQLLTLVVYDAFAKLKERVQSIVVMPNVNGNITEDGGIISPSYLVTPASMAKVIADKYNHGVQIELRATTDDNGSSSSLYVNNVTSDNNGVLSISASTYSMAKTVSLHVFEDKKDGFDYMTEFTPLDDGQYHPDTPDYGFCPDNHHPHVIDLGLPSGRKWACCNVGATAPDQYGGYYAWGEVKEKNVYSIDTYQYKGSFLDIGGTQYDAARASWGKSWQMPTSSELYELFWDSSSQELTSVGDVRGIKIIGRNGNAIFMPAAGFKFTGSKNGKNMNGLMYPNILGYYWSSSPVLYEISQSPSLYSLAPYYFPFEGGDITIPNFYYNGLEATGMSVRAVYK